MNVAARVLVNVGGRRERSEFNLHWLKTYDELFHFIDVFNGLRINWGSTRTTIWLFSIHPLSNDTACNRPWKAVKQQEVTVFKNLRQGHLIVPDNEYLQFVYFEREEKNDSKSQGTLIVFVPS